jgi:hypothetical protein
MIMRAVSSGLRVTSRPTAMRPRAHGQSKVRNLRTIAANLRQLMVLRRHLGPIG